MYAGHFRISEAPPSSFYVESHYGEAVSVQVINALRRVSIGLN